MTERHPDVPKERSLVAVAIALVALMSSCSSGRYLKTEGVGALEISGNVTLILYGGRYSADMQNVAILYREGGQYTFEVYAPSFDYTVTKEVPAKEAVAAAERHVRSHHAFWQSWWRGILDYDGNIIGYELRPLYSSLDTGYPDILDVSYIIKDSKVIVRIRFRQEIEKSLLEEEGPLLFRMRR